MELNDDEKLNKVEELKSKLFSKNFQQQIEHRDRFSDLAEKNVPDVWEDQKKSTADPFYSPQKFFMKTSIFKNFFIFSIVFFVLAMGYAGYVFFAGGNTVSNDNIDISVLGNNFVAGGEELSLVVGIANRNSSPLDLVDLVLEYPKNSSSTGATTASTPMERSRVSLGTIPAGAVHNENVKLTLFGEQGSQRPIKISIEYRVAGSNAIFVKEKPYQVTISSTPVNLSVDAPDTISPNQDITLNVKVSLNSTHTASNMLLKVDYPVGFQFKSSDPQPTLANNIWSLGDLAPGSEHNIAITGKMVDVFDGEEKAFQVSSGSQSATDKSTIDVVFNSLSQIVQIKKPFIEAKLYINGTSASEYTNNAKNQITGEIRWTNNLDTKVNDLVISAKVFGNALDRKSVTVDQGFYNSGEDTITWDKNSQQDFAEVNPGDSGTVRFSFASLSLFSATAGALSNPAINVDVSISGKQLVENYADKDLSNIESSTIKIISDVGFTSKLYYYSGPFTNHGPIPPKVEQKTSYAVSWALSNTSNSVSKSAIRTTLPAWVNFVGAFSPKDEDLIYNPSTREVTWNIGTIPKGTGITSASRSVSFQVELTPSLSQVGSSPNITKDSTLTGHDDFANVDVTVNKAPLDTFLGSDPSSPASAGSVVTE